MRRTPAPVVAGLLVAALAGCVGRYESDFQLIVVNRTSNAIVVAANGSELGQVASSQQGTFTLRLPETNSNTYTDGVGPTPQGEVTLTARDVRTGSVSNGKTVTLSASAPVSVTFAAADFAAPVPTLARFTVNPNNPGVNQDVTFNGSASTPNTGNFNWSFGDGTSGTGITTIHRYERPGSFLVTLTVTTEAGQTSVATATVNVTTTLPPGQAMVNFTFSPSAPGINQDVFFNASTSTVSGGTFAWDFGDGGTATGVTTTHRFARAGTFTVTLRASNAAGQAGAVSRTVTVSATSPQVTASFSFSPTGPGINQQIFFDASASMPATGTYSWNFGDGTNGTGVRPTHQYRSAATYTVTLTVTNDIGQSATTTRTVTVSATSPQVTASFVFSPTVPGPDQEVFLDASASRPITGTFSWSFGDGRTGGGTTTTHRYSTPGTYTITLVVANEFGQTATATRTITVSGVSPQVFASFTFSPTAPGINQEVFFNASASRPPDGTYSWNFGDGATGSGLSPTHRYAQPATYTVTLTVFNGLGQQATTTRTVTVSTSSSTLVADFTFSPTDPSITRGTNAVIFDATPSTGNIIVWTWDYGDGSPFESGPRNTHTFSRLGTWVVRLTVSDFQGRTATVTKNVTVTQ